MVDLGVASLYILVGVMWGCTNPFIKHAQSKAKTNASDGNDPFSVFRTIRMFFSNPALFVPFLVNQTGSLCFYFLMATQPITVASPICNSLAFVFTALTGYGYFKEEVQSWSALIAGTSLVLLGSYICLNA